VDPNDSLKLLSIVIPARNEAENLEKCITEISKSLVNSSINHQILVIDDGSTDDTAKVMNKLHQLFPKVENIKNNGPNGFGRAVVLGLDKFAGDAVAIMMADCSDSPKDLIKYWNTLQKGYDAVFGSRFIAGSKLYKYPFGKRILNRIVNILISYAFKIKFNDTTNAFKIYRRQVIEGCRPFISPHFNLTVEIPLKTIIRGYSWTAIPISWKNRTTGIAKLKLKEMGSRYFFIIAYLWLEKYFSRGDYVYKNKSSN
jgi:dolichol-phosphate mannosyltransferase